MAQTVYNYTISIDFPNQAVNTDDLTLEIQNSAIVIALDYLSTSGDNCDIAFKDALSTGDKTILDGLVAAHQGLPQVSQPDPSVSERGGLKVELAPTTGTQVTIVSHDWSDPTTWYSSSIQDIDEIASVVPNSGYTKYRVDHSNIIDLYHGKIFDEDQIRTSGGYGVTVKVNDVEKTYDVDYSVDFEKGEIRFQWIECGRQFGMGPLTAPDVVKVSYSYATDSIFKITPAATKVLRVAKAEIQFTVDCLLEDSILFAVFAGGFEVPGTRRIYKGAKDYIAVGNNGVGVIHPFGGPRKGLYHDSSVFPFEYQTATDLKDSIQTEIRVWLENDLPVKGEYSSVTFYCIEEDE